MKRLIIPILLIIIALFLFTGCSKGTTHTSNSQTLQEQINTLKTELNQLQTSINNINQYIQNDTPTSNPEYSNNPIVNMANSERAAVQTAVEAYAADNNGRLPCNVQPTTGKSQPLLTSDIDTYLTSPPLGSYIVNVGGNITGISYPDYPAPVWDTINSDWK
ncbi:MAG: hypothetical protein ACLPVI_07235 [Dehalococcoidales bacterium]